MTVPAAPTGPGPLLVTRVPPSRANIAATMQRVRAVHGVGYLRQAWQMLVLHFGPGRITPLDYLQLGLYRTSLDRSAKRAYIGLGGARPLAARLHPGDLATAETLLVDKILAGRLMAVLGAPVPREIAVFPPHPALQADPAVAALPDTAAIAAFLARPDVGPMQGKPVHGTRSLGQVSILGPGPAEGTLRLADGRTCEAGALAQEIAAAYPDGYLFQERLTPPPELGPLALQGATLRIVTVRTRTGARPLYALWKIPRTYRGDDLPAGLGRYGTVDLETGEVRPADPSVGAPPVAIPGAVEAFATAARLHAALPGFGILGWDAMPTDAGLKFVEVNAKPFHINFEMVAGRGLASPTWKPDLDEAEAIARSRRGVRLPAVTNLLRRLRLAGPPRIGDQR